MADDDQPRKSLDTRTRAREINDAKVYSSSLNDLEDSLIIEILHRLPSYKQAIQCKSVCKNWYSLISNPYFICRFMSVHDKVQNPSTLLIDVHKPYYDANAHRSDFRILYNRHLFHFDFSYLPEDSNQVVHVVASYNDLLLCCLPKVRDNVVTLQHYICNPFTKQWVSLPPVIHKGGHIRQAFVCEPCYVPGPRGEYTMNSDYKFSVVLLTRALRGMKFILQNYCSVTGKWVESIHKGNQYFWRTNIVAYHGKLHWYSGKNVIAFDPFKSKFCFMDASHDSGIVACYCFYSIGVCHGLLRMMRLLINSRNYHTSTLTVWELKDYVTGKWSLEHKIYLSSIIPFAKRMKIGCVGFHPSDRDVAYLYVNEMIIMGNLQTREVELVDRLPFTMTGFLAYFYYNSVCPVVVPCWPTPIPHVII